MRLTAKQVRDAKPTAKPQYLRDDSPAGLALRIGTNGRRSWVLDYRAPDGRKRRWTIGTAEAFTLDQARDAASAAQRGLIDGIDPLDVKQDRKDAPTIDDLLDYFENEFVPRRIKLGKMKQRTADEYRRQITSVIRPALGVKKVDAVSKRDIQKALAELRPIQHNRILALLSRLFSMAESEGWRPQASNPALGIDRFTEERRERTLTTDELTALGTALANDTKANAQAVLAIRLAAFTGLRIGEVRKLRWELIDLTTGRIKLPETKTGARFHSLPTPAQALLSDAAKIGPWVISGRTDAKPLDYGVIRKTFGAACEAAEIEGVTLHDLRRTVMTNVARTGASVPMLQALLGHKTPTMAVRYVAFADSDVVDLRERAGSETAAAMAGQPTAEVVGIKRR